MKLIQLFQKENFKDENNRELIIEKVKHKIESRKGWKSHANIERNTKS